MNPIARLMNQLPPRLRMFLTPVLTVVLAWLATTGLIDTVQRGDPFTLVKLAVLLFGSALAAFIRPVPAEYITPVKNAG